MTNRADFNNNIPQSNLNQLSNHNGRGEIRINGCQFTPSRIGIILLANTGEEACMGGKIDNALRYFANNIKKNTDILMIFSLFDNNPNNGIVGRCICRFTQLAQQNNTSDTQFNINNKNIGNEVTDITFIINGIPVLELQQHYDGIHAVTYKKSIIFGEILHPQTIKMFSKAKLPSVSDLDTMLENFKNISNSSPLFPITNNTLSHNYSELLTNMNIDEIIALAMDPDIGEPNNVDRYDSVYTKHSNATEKSGEYIGVYTSNKYNNQKFLMIKLCGGFEHTNTTCVRSVGSTKIAIHDFMIGCGIINQFSADELLNHGILPSHMLAYIDSTDNFTSVVTFIAPQTQPLLTNDYQPIPPAQIANILAGLLNTIDFLNNHGLAVQITSLAQLRVIPNSDGTKVYIDPCGMVTTFEPACDILLDDDNDDSDDDSDNNQTNIMVGLRRYEPIWFRPSGDFVNKSYDVGEMVTKCRNRRSEIAKSNPRLQIDSLNIPRISSTNNKSNPLLIKSTNTTNSITKPAENYTTYILESRNLAMVISIIWAITREFNPEDGIMDSFHNIRAGSANTIGTQKNDFSTTFNKLGIYDSKQLTALKAIMFNIHPYTYPNIHRSNQTLLDARAALEQIVMKMDPQIYTELVNQRIDIESKEEPIQKVDKRINVYSEYRVKNPKENLCLKSSNGNICIKQNDTYNTEVAIEIDENCYGGNITISNDNDYKEMDHTDNQPGIQNNRSIVYLTVENKSGQTRTKPTVSCGPNSNADIKGDYIHLKAAESSVNLEGNEAICEITNGNVKIVGNNAKIDAMSNSIVTVKGDNATIYNVSTGKINIIGNNADLTKIKKEVGNKILEINVYGNNARIQALQNTKITIHGNNVQILKILGQPQPNSEIYIHGENTIVNYPHSAEKLFINDQEQPQYKLTRFGRETEYQDYINSRIHDIKPENIIFINEIVQINPTLFEREVATFDEFTVALEKTGVAFLMTGEKYTPLYKETVPQLKMRYDYTNSDHEQRDHLDRRDLMSPGMLLTDLKHRIKSGELASPDNETK